MLISLGGVVESHEEEVLYGDPDLWCDANLDEVQQGSFISPNYGSCISFAKLSPSFKFNLRLS